MSFIKNGRGGTGDNPNAPINVAYRETSALLRSVGIRPVAIQRDDSNFSLLVAGDVVIARRQDTWLAASADTPDWHDPALIPDLGDVTQEQWETIFADLRHIVDLEGDAGSVDVQRLAADA